MTTEKTNEIERLCLFAEIETRRNGISEQKLLQDMSIHTLLVDGVVSDARMLVESEKLKLLAEIGILKTAISCALSPTQSRPNTGSE